MAELIEKEAFYNKMNNLTKYNTARYNNAVDDCMNLLDEMPTTTEAEIRAKAYDRFMKEIEAEYDNDACPNVTDYLDYKISLRDLFRIAEQLKEEA